ncbi:MAG: caspase family protein [Leptospirales bacterium]
MKNLKSFTLYFMAIACTSIFFSDLPANEKPNFKRYALVVGSNSGGSDRVKLKYSISDAKAVRTTLNSIGGVEDDAATLLADPSVAQLARSLQILHNIGSKHRKNGTKTEIFFYYSGHSDEEGLLLGKEKFEYSRLKSIIEKMPFDVRIVVLDSCSSGAMTRSKGGRKRAPFINNNSNSMKGNAYLTSSSSDENSQESDRLKGSFFTHYFLSGLRGAADSNKDRQITLSEIYQYAYSATLARTEKTIGGPQHANYYIQMTGTGDVVITNLRRNTAILHLASNISGNVFIRNQKGQLVTEFYKPPKQTYDIGLESGSHTVMVIQNSNILNTVVTMKKNETVRLNENDLTPVAGDESVSKKGDEEETAPELIYTPFSFQLFPMVGSLKNHTTFSLFLVGSYNYRITGVSVGVGVDIVKESMQGVQVSVGANIVGTHMQGVQATVGGNLVFGPAEGVQTAVGFNNVTGTFSGVQAAVGFNCVAGQFSGVQVSAGFNCAMGQFSGVQVSNVNISSGTSEGVQVGLVNIGRQVKGVQVGLVNVSEENSGVAIGLVNVFKNGYHGVDTWADEVGYFHLGYRHGNDKFYNLYSAGVHYSMKTAKATIGFGFQLPNAGPVGFSIDFLSSLEIDKSFSLWNNSRYDRVNGLENFESNYTNSIRFLTHIKFGDRFGLIAGVSLNHTANNMPASYIPGLGDTINGHSFWPGFFIGMRY